MSTDPIDPLLRDAASTYRADSTTDLDALWDGIERAHFDAPLQHRRALRRWVSAGIGIAATLAIGVGIGRMTATPTATAIANEPVITPVTLPVIVINAPLQQVTSTYVAQATSLMTSLVSSAAQNRGAPLGTRAAELLATTRLLLDSPVGSDPKMRALLEDLELVLAQIVALPTTSDPTDRRFIAEAMTEREVLPRLLDLATAYSPY